MSNRKFYRLTSLLIILAVLFVQAGISLLHNHQSIPPVHPSTLQASSNSTSCNACAMDGVPVLYAQESPAFVVFHFFAAPLPSVAEGEVFLISDSQTGRAPPVC